MLGGLVLAGLVVSVVLLAVNNNSDGAPPPFSPDSRCTGRLGRFNVGVRNFFVADHSYEAFALYNATRSEQMWPENQRYRMHTVLYPTFDADGEPYTDWMAPYQHGTLSPDVFGFAAPADGTLVLQNASLALPGQLGGERFDAVLYVPGQGAYLSYYATYAVQLAATGRIVVSITPSNEDPLYGALRGQTPNDAHRVDAYVQLLSLDAYQRPFLARAFFNWIVGGAAKTTGGVPFSAAYSGRVATAGHSLGAQTAMIVGGGVSGASCETVFARYLSSPVAFFNSPPADVAAQCAALQTVGADASLAPFVLWDGEHSVSEPTNIALDGITGVIANDAATSTLYEDFGLVGQQLDDGAPSVLFTQPSHPFTPTDTGSLYMRTLYDAISIPAPNGAPPIAADRFKAFAQTNGTWHSSYAAADVCRFFSSVVNTTENIDFFRTVGSPLYNSIPLWYDPLSTPVINSGLFFNYAKQWCPSSPLFPGFVINPTLLECMCTSLQTYAHYEQITQASAEFLDATSRGCRPSATDRLVDRLTSYPLVFLSTAFDDGTTIVESAAAGIADDAALPPVVEQLRGWAF